MAKPITAGFLEDCEKLLDDFLTTQSAEFKDFAIVWKKHNFVCIYMGHDEKHLREFTNGIFHQTLKFLSIDSILIQIGAVYTLYGLYRNQILDPAVQIRITLPNYTILQNMYSYAQCNNIKSLQYIICYLNDNAFDCVAELTLHGPTSFMRKQYDEPIIHYEAKTQELQNCLKEMENSIFLKEMKDLTLQYMDASKKFLSPNDPILKNNKEFLLDTEHYAKQFEDLKSNREHLNEKKDNNELSQEADIGSRRLRIKSKAYQKKTGACRNRVDSQEDEETSCDDISRAPPVVPKKVRNRRVPAAQRRAGRPRKQVKQEQSSSESDDFESPEDGLSLKRTGRRGPIARKSYYEE